MEAVAQEVVSNVALSLLLKGLQCTLEDEMAVSLVVAILQTYTRVHVQLAISL